MYHHEHPVKILRYSIKNLWLLIFPLLRSIQLVSLSPDAVYRWFVGSWFDLVICCFILGIAALRWYCCKFRFDQQKIEYKSGVFLRRTTAIPFPAITCATEEHPFLLRPIRIVRLKLDTCAGRTPQIDMNLILKRSDLLLLRKQIPMLHECNTPTKPYHPHAMLIFLFSFLFSSSLSGTVYLITLFVQAGRICSDLARQFQVDQVVEQITDTATHIFVFQHIPKIVLLIGIILGLLWLLSFVANLLRYGRFRVQISDNVLSLHMGILNRRRIHLRRGAVNFVDIRQNLLMKLFGAESVHISCPGYGFYRKALPVLIPMVTNQSMPIPLSTLLEGVNDTPPQPQQRLHARMLAFWSFLWQPLSGIGAVILAAVLANHFFPAFRRITFFLMLLILIPLTWMVLIRLVSIRSQYLSLWNGQLQLHYSSGFTFHTITTPASHVVACKIRRTPFSSKSGNCTLYVSLRGQSKKTHRLMGMSLQSAERFLQAVAAQQDFMP